MVVFMIGGNDLGVMFYNWVNNVVLSFFFDVIGLSLGIYVVIVIDMRGC